VTPVSRLTYCGSCRHCTLLRPLPPPPRPIHTLSARHFAHEICLLNTAGSSHISDTPHCTASTMSQTIKPQPAALFAALPAQCRV
jgi:hypothetical protein